MIEKNFEIDAQAAALAQAFAGLAGDLAVVLDAKGQVLAIAGGAAAPGPTSGEAGQVREDRETGGKGPAGSEDWKDWTGHPWQELAAVDSRVKAAALLNEALCEGHGRRREMNLCRGPAASRAGPHETAAFSCSALRLGGNMRAARVLVVGRDLNATAALQQQLLSRQAQLEGAYWALQRAEPPS